MNRRGFFTTLLAAPVAAVVALKAKATPALPQDARDAVLHPQWPSELPNYDAFVKNALGVSVKADHVNDKDECVVHVRVDAEEAKATLRELEGRINELNRSLADARMRSIRAGEWATR